MTKQELEAALDEFKFEDMLRSCGRGLKARDQFEIIIQAARAHLKTMAEPYIAETVCKNNHGELHSPSMDALIGAVRDLEHMARGVVYADAYVWKKHADTIRYCGGKECS